MLLRRRLLLRLLELVQLLFRLVQLLFRLVQRVLLHQHRLGQNIEGVRIAAQRRLDELLRVGVFVGEDGLVHAIGKSLEELLFLRSHGYPRLRFEQYDAG